MKTSAISNPLATGSGNPNAKSNASVEIPFGQLLAREVSNRSNSSSNQPNSTRANEDKADAASSRAPSTETNTVDDAQPTATATDVSRTAHKGESSEVDKVKDEEADLAAASAELLGLVAASLNQTMASRVEGKGQANAAGANDKDLDPLKALSGGGDHAAPTELSELPSDPSSTQTLSETTTLDAVQTALTDPAAAPEGALVPRNPGQLASTVAQAANFGKGSAVEIDGASTKTGRGPVKADLPGHKPGLGKSQATTAEVGERHENEARPGQAAEPATAHTGNTAPDTERLAPTQSESAVVKTELQSAASTQNLPPMAAPAAVNTAQPHVTNAAAANHLAAYVGTPGWDHAVSQKVVWMVSNGEQSASLTLNPPDLGPLKVVVSVSNSQATASFTAAQPEVRQALENALPKLRDMLNDAGIQLGQANVSAGDPSHQQGAFARHESRAPTSSRTSEQIDGVDGPQTLASRPAKANSQHQGLVDTFV